VILLSLLLTLACGGQPAATTSTGSSTGSSTAPASTTASSAARSPADIDVSQLKEKVDAGGTFVLDVRTPGEFSQGHVPGAVNIPLQELNQRMGEVPVPKDQPFEVICAVGGRSAVATQELRKAGWSQAINVKGGTAAWVSAGYPTE